MSNPTPHDGDRFQIRAQEIKNRVDADPAFRRQVESDPVGALVSAGLPQDSIIVADQSTGTPEVSGFRMADDQGTCVLWGFDECLVWIKW